MSERIELPPLRRDDLVDDPVDQFEAWFAFAREHVPLPEAMTLATVDDEGMPDARMVLLKGWDERGPRFFTNSGSVKGEQLAARPEAALIVYWRELDRQVRVRGSVEQLSGVEADQYFASRPRVSQLGAWASAQSRPLADRAAFDSAFAEVAERFGGEDGGEEIPRPDYWVGYLVRPRQIEFWQGQRGRLHDRFRYTGGDGRGGWTVTRLSP